MRRTVLALTLVLAAVAATRADDPPEPTYADKPASWWVEELVSGDNSDAARIVLRRMGDAAAPQIAAALGTARSTEARRKLLDLLRALRTLPPAAVPPLRTFLTNGNRYDQVAALEVVEHAGAAGAPLAEDVAALLASPESSVRFRAASALGALGEAAAPFVPALVARIGADQPATDRAVVAALGRIGPGAAPALPRLLELAAARAPDWTNVRALTAIGPDDPRVADEIARAVETGDERTRKSALEFIHDPKPPGEAAYAAALRFAKSDDKAVRAAAAGGLGSVVQARKKDVPDALFTLLGDDDLVVVGAAARALEARAATDHSILPRVAAVWRVTKFPMSLTGLMRTLRPESGAALLETALADDAALRQASWHVLTRTGEGGLLADARQVSRMLFDARVDLTQRANLFSLVSGMHSLPPDTFREVCVALATEGEPVLAAAAIPSLYGDANRRAALISVAARREPELRAAALSSLSPMLPRFEDVRAAVVRSLGDDDPAVRTRALQIAQSGGFDAWSQAGPARDALAARLGDFVGAGIDERRAVCGVLSALPDDARPVAVLVGLLAHDDVAEMAITLLAHTSADPRDLLRPLLAGDDPALAARAARVWLSRYADDEIVAKLAGWIGSDDRRVAREAAIAAAGLRPETIVGLGGALVRAARGGVEGVAWPACSALFRISEREPAAREALLAVADDARNSAQLAVIPALADLGDLGVARLVAFLDHPARDARRNACTVIADAARRGVTGLGAAVPALERLAKCDDLELARLAKAALDAVRR